MIFLCPCEDNKEPDHRNRETTIEKNNLLPKTRQRISAIAQKDY